MKVLHLYSDWRWTGPAEPTVNLCHALGRLGIEVILACSPPLDGYPVSLAEEARKRGLRVLTNFYLHRYLNPMKTLKDLCTLPSFMKREGIQLVHCHLSHDHALGGWAARAMGLRIIRSNHKARPMKGTLGNKWLMARWTDGIIEFSRVAMERDSEKFAFPHHRMLLVEGAIDLERFDPTAPGKDVRGELGVNSNEILCGIIARVQRHRRWDLVLGAMEILAKRVPQLRLMVIGRGTHLEELMVRPVRERGLGHRVIFTGYRRGDYVDYLRAMDFKVFLVPGSDGTCRAVREAMAMGKPIVCTKRGILPELVEEGKTGILVDEKPEELASAMERVALDRELRERMGKEARARALRDFSVEKQAGNVAEFYERILSMENFLGPSSH